MMRRDARFLVAWASLLAACGSTSSSATIVPEDASVSDVELLAAEDGNTSACTAVGGTCMPFTQACPPLQQNTALCEDTLLVCCLPPGGPRVPMGDDGGQTQEGAAPPAEGGVGTDSGSPTKDAAGD